MHALGGESTVKAAPTTLEGRTRQKAFWIARALASHQAREATVLGFRVNTGPLARERR